MLPFLFPQRKGNRKEAATARGASKWPRGAKSSFALTRYVVRPPRVPPARFVLYGIFFCFTWNLPFSL